MAKKMVVFCGSDHVEKAFPPFMLSGGAIALDMEITLFFTMSGLNIIKKGGAEKITLKGAPKTLPGFLDLMKEYNVRMIACSAALPLVNMTEKDIIDGVEFNGIATFLALAEEADIVLTF